jgi:NTP pyrophosphatase (non-canonical NTP hydrolase)|tara:strand:+ start:2201 stop:2602 length:402 start_codon:yes stop_codon:yes gene_type:complete
LSKIDDYAKFVDTTTSLESKRFLAFIDSASKLEACDNINVPRVLTSAIGMLAESGEFTEILKKIVFQGKEFNESERFHMKRELGDILWYWVQGCVALGYTPDQVMDENIKKLEARYPNGFEVARSEHRKEGDI